MQHRISPNFQKSHGYWVECGYGNWHEDDILWFGPEFWEGDFWNMRRENRWTNKKYTKLRKPSHKQPFHPFWWRVVFSKKRKRK